VFVNDAGYDSGAMLAACPKCDLPDVATEECPRCGVATSRYRTYVESLGPLGTPAPASPPVRAAPPPAGFWRRAAACLLDWVVVLVAGAVFRFAARLLWGEVTTSSRVLVASAKGFEIVFALYYMTLLHWLWGQTLGKMAMGVRVVDVSGEPIGMGRAIVRTLGYLVSEATLGVGFLIAALRSDRRALHDLIAGTRVERVNRSGGG
jgi:uncharacterized RDD family membrane protein YckC